VLCPRIGGGSCRGCVVGWGAGCDVIAIGVWVGVAVVVGWGSVIWGLRGGQWEHGGGA
jgi:hypothetical protein